MAEKIPNSVPENNYTTADKIALGLYVQRETLPELASPGQASKLNIDLMRQQLGDDFQLHKGEKYLVDTYNTKMSKQFYETAKAKADEQGFWGEMLGFTAQAVGGEILLGTLEGVGYLLDFDHWVDRLSGGEGDWGNWLSDMAAGGQKSIQEAFPIHKDPDGQGRGFWQNALYTDGWWAQNGVSIASALSLLIPVAGWARGVGMAGKGINYLGKLGRTGSFGTAGIKSMNLVDDLILKLPQASKTTKIIADGVHKAVVSRHLENHMEAAAVYDEQYKKYRAQGMSDEEAKKAAGEGAAFTYKAGWAMLLTDIPQYLMLGRAFNASKAILNTKVAKAADQSLLKTIGLNVGEYAKQFATEGFEEAYQFVVSEEGKYHADVIAGLVDPESTSLIDRLGKYSKDGELWTAAFFGGLGGVAFQAVGNPTTEFINKKLLSKGEGILTQNEARLQEIMNRKQIFSANVKSYFEAVDANDERAFEAAKGRIGFDLGVMAAKVGNWSLAKGSMEQLKNSSKEEREAFGFGDAEDFNNNIDKYIADAEEAVRLYSKNVTKYEASTVEAITYREYMINQYSKKLPQLRRNVAELKQKMPLINDLSANGKAAFEAKLQAKAQERYIKAAEWKLNNMKMPIEDQESLRANIELAKEAIKQHTDNINTYIDQGLSNTEKVTLNSLDSALAEDLSKAEAEIKWTEHYLDQYSKEVSIMASKEFQNKIKVKEDAEADKAKRSAKSSKKAEKIQKDKDQLNGVLHSEEQEYSKEYASSEVATTLENLSKKLDSNEVSWDSLDKETKEAVLNYKKQKELNKNNNLSKEEGINEDFGEEGAFDINNLNLRDASEDHKKQEENSTEYLEQESPSNPDSELVWRAGDDIAKSNITRMPTPLAWKSYNNPWTTKEEKTDAMKALSNFLEGNNSLQDVEVVFDINYDWLYSEKNAGDKYFNKIKAELQSNTMPTDIGFVPISATLYKNGKPIVYAGHTMKMNLHDKDFFFDADVNGVFNIPKTEASEEQLATLETHKRAIIEAHFKKQTLKAKITGKTNGQLLLVESKDGEYAKNTLSEVLGPLKDVEFLHGNSHKGYINADGTLNQDLFHYTSATNGAIYALTKTANGSKFPLRLHIDNINRSEASFIYKIYVDLLSNETLFNQPISDEIRKAINTSGDIRIKGLEKYLDLNKLSYKELLMHLIYEGKKTETKGDSRLLTYPKNPKTNSPAVISFGKFKYDLKALTSPEGREQFINHIVRHRRRQVDIKLLDNVDYKQYLSDSKILTTNVGTTSTKNIFVQPTISYSPDLEVSTSDKTYVDVVVENLQKDLEYEKTSEFGNPDNIKLIEDQISKLTNKEEIEIPEAPKETINGGVQIEIDFNEDNAFDLSKIIPNPEIKIVSNETIDNTIEIKKADIERRRQEKIKEKQLTAGQKVDTYEGLDDGNILYKVQIETRGDGKKRLLLFSDKINNWIPSSDWYDAAVPDEKIYAGILYENIKLIDSEIKDKTNLKLINAKYDAELAALENKNLSNREQIADYNANEARDAEIAARKARLERARKKREDGETGAFKRFKNEDTDFESRVNYALKAVNILQSEKAIQMFDKGQKNNWPLDKILTELQIPKEQKQIILDKYKDKISEQDFIKSIFPDTKINQVVYHRTNNNFDKFSKDYFNSSTGQAEFGKGFYFSSGKDNVIFGKNLKSVILNLENPLTFKSAKDFGDKLVNNYTTDLRKGYDGVISGYEFLDLEQHGINKNNLTKEEQERGDYLINDILITKADQYNQYVAFEPEQIHILTEEEQAKIYNQDNLREEIITSLLAENSYTVEINTAKRPINEFYNDFGDYDDPYEDEDEEILLEQIAKETLLLQEQLELGIITQEQYISKKTTLNLPFKDIKLKNYNDNSEYYINLTVPGGTNYTERAIKLLGVKLRQGSEGNYHETDFNNNEGDMLAWSRQDELAADTSIVRIQEIQSRLQKHRGETKLTEGSELENSMLQLFAKDDNWVTFVIKSLVQQAAKEGKSKIWFPKGETAAKIEGHETLALEIKRIDKIIEDVEINPNKYFNNKDNAWIHADTNFTVVEQSKEDFIESLKDEKSKLKSQGIEKLKPIEAFYEIKVGNILGKQFGKENVKTITDEYGNEWYEVEIKDEYLNEFAFRRFRKNYNQKFELEKEIAKIEQILPKEIGINLIPDFIKVLSQGNVAVGMFKNGMITISEKAPKGTAYHEAGHAVFRTLLSLDQQTALIEEAKENFEKPTEDQLSMLMSDHKVDRSTAEALFYEEVIMDEFAIYMDNPELANHKSNYSKGIKGFFQKLMDWIKYVFSNKLTTRKLFSSINAGRFKTKTPLIVKNVAFKAHPFFSANEVREITQQLAYAAFSKVTSLNNIKDNFNTQLILDTLDNAELQAVEMNNEVGNLILNNISKLYDNKGNLDQFWIKKIEDYIEINFDLRESNKIDSQEDLDSENIENLEINNFLKSSYEMSGKDNATSTVKFLIAMTPQIDSYIDGRPVYKKSSLLGLPMFNDFGTTYNYVEKSLAGIVPISENGQLQDALELMKNKLKSDFKYKPELKFILDKLETMDESVQNQFHYTFSRQRGNYIDHLLEGKLGDIESKIGPSDIESKEKVIKDSWASVFSQNMGIYNSSGEYNYNPEMIEVFFNIFNSFRASLAVEIATNVMPSEKTMHLLTTSLGVLGVTLSPRTLEKILDDTMFSNPNPVAKALYSLKTFETNYTNAVMDLKTKIGPLDDSTNLILNENSFFKNILAANEANFRKIGGESSFLGPEGNQYYTYQDNTLTSKTIAEFKQGDLSNLVALKESDYGTHSLWLNYLLDPKNGEKNREKFKTALYGNYKKLNDSDRGDKASNLKPADQYLDSVNKYLHGIFIGLAEADKTQQTYIVGPKVESAGVSYAPAQGKPFFANEDPRAARILIGYLADELMRMETARRAFYGYTDPITGEKLPPLAEKEQILYYHYNIDNDGNRIPGNALQSFLFPNINLEQLGLKDPDTGEIYPLTIESFDNNKELLDYIKTSFLDAVTSELQVASDFGLIKREGDKYINKGIANKHLSDRNGNVVGAIADYVLNSIIANVEQTKMFNGDPAFYKVKLTPGKQWSEQPIFTDFMKRIPASGAAGKDFRSFNNPDGTVAVRSKYISATIDNIKTESAFFGEVDDKGNTKFNDTNLELISKNTGVSVSELKEIFKPYLKINQTDAQAWITLDAYRERLRGLGKWTFGENSHESAYLNVLSDKPLSYSELSLLSQPLKTVHTELLRLDGNIMAMQYNKQSEAVLLPSLVKGTELDNLRIAMESQGIDHVIVLDGKKVGAKGITKITDANNKILSAKDIKLNGVPLSYSRLFLQQDLPTKGITPIQVGTQGVKNLLSVLDIKESYLDNVTGTELYNEYHRVKSTLSDKGLIKFKQEIGFNEEAGELERDENGILKYNKLLQKEFLGDISDDHIEALNYNIDLDALPIKDKIQNKGNAMLTKRAVKLKQMGAALIQMSDFGFVGAEVNLNEAVKDNIIWFKNPKERFKPMHITEEGVKPAQILIPWTQGKKIQKILKKHNIKLQDLTHEQIKVMIDPKVLQGLSYRIPNQGPSSNDAFEIVGILPPQAGDTMVAFSDITTKTGSDFDIDKAFIILPEFFFNEKTGKIEKIPYDKNNETEKGLENYALDIMRAMLMHPKAYVNVMKPLDNPWLEDLAKKLYPEEVNNTSLNFFKGSTQLMNKATFDNAKNLVGVIANHMSHHSLVLHENLYFNNYYLGKGIKDKNGNTSLSNILDENGNLITDTLGAFMNAIVDAAKDPYISRANINQITANTAFMLARAGINREWIVTFMGRPVLKDYVKIMSLKEGRFAEKEYDEDGNIKDALTEILAKYNSNLLPGQLYSSDNNLANLDGNISVTTEQLLKSDDDSELQIKILAQFLQWQKKAKNLNDLIKVCKADVNGATKNLTRAKLAENLLRKVVIQDQIGNVDKLLGYSITEDGQISFDNDMPKRMIGTYFKNSVLASREVFDGLFISTTPAAETVLDIIAAEAGYVFLEPNEDHEQIADKINNEIYAMTAYQTDAFNIDHEELHKLLYGVPGEIKFGKVIPRQFSLGNRIMQAKSGPLKDNLLISSLEVKGGSKYAPFKIYLPNNETTKAVKDDLYLAWLDLYNSDAKDLADDLIKYAFYSSGFSKGIGSFYEHIPMDKLKELNFSEQIKSIKLSYSDPNALLEKRDMIFKNLYKDNRIVPIVNQKHIYTVVTADNIKFDTNDIFVVLPGEGEGYIAGEDINKNVVFKSFLKREFPIYNTFQEKIGTTTTLYQLQGYTNSGGAVYVKTNKLGFNSKGNTIKEYIGDGQTSLFKENNVTLPLEVLKVVNNLEPNRIAVTTFEKTPNIKRKPSKDREHRLNFCINTQ